MAFVLTISPPLICFFLRVMAMQVSLYLKKKKKKKLISRNNHDVYTNG